MDDASKAGPSKDGHDSTSKKRKKTVTKIIHDPIWGPIELHELCIKIIDTPQFQRLRFIKQMGVCSFVYPGACHTRFEHSIGTSHLAGTLVRHLKENQSDVQISDEEVLCVEVAGLCHDLGHGPFSHLFDEQFIKKVRPNPEWKHEDASRKMIDEIFETKTIRFEDYMERNYIDFIKDLIKKCDKPSDFLQQQRRNTFLYEIVSNGLNKIDVDKWDYFSRDCHMLGLQHNFQCKRMIKLARVVDHNEEKHISFPKSEYFNLFDIFYTRFTLHRKACEHHVAQALDMMVTDALLKADKSLKFPPNRNEDLKRCLSESVDDMEAYLWVTDDVFNQIRTLKSKATDDDIQQAQKIIERILSRDLYKLIGEKRVTGAIEKGSLDDLKKSLEQRMKTPNIDENLYELKVVIFNYGNGDANPMTNVKFYQKVKNETTQEETIQSAIMDETQISDMLPKIFEQIFVRLYWKGSRHNDTNNTDRKEITEKFTALTDHSYQSTVKVKLVDVNTRTLQE